MNSSNLRQVEFSALPVFAGAVVLSSDGRVLNQLRDEKLNILFPGYWSCAPGGHVNPGESPDRAVVREMKEEFGIALKNIKPIATLYESEGEIAGTHHSFSADLATPLAEVQCFEGQRVQFFHPDQAMQLKQIPLSKEILKIYLKSVTSSNNL